MRLFVRLVWVELKLFAREPLAVMFAFALPLVVLSVLTGLYGNAPNPSFDFAVPSAYYAASYLGVVIACVGLVAVPVHVATYRERGILRRFRASSVPASSVVGAQILVALVVVTAGGGLLVAVSALAYGAALPSSPVDTLGAFVLGSLSFLALGFLVAVVMPTARAAQAAGLVLLLPMWLLSGAGPPRGVMTPTMREIGAALPLTHVVRVLQDAWLGQPTSAAEFVVLSAILVGSSGLSILVMRRT